MLVYPVYVYGWSSLKDDRVFSGTLHQDFSLGKDLGSPEKFGRKQVKLLRDLTEKSVNFSTLATCNIRLVLVLGEEDQ